MMQFEKKTERVSRENKERVLKKREEWRGRKVGPRMEEPRPENEQILMNKESAKESGKYAEP